MPIQFQVGKLSDKAIIEVIEAIEMDLGATQKNFQGAEVNFNTALDVIKSKKTPTYLFTEAYISTEGGKFTVRILRDTKPNSIYFDDVIIQPRTNPAPTAADLLLLEDVIRSKIRMPALKAPSTSESAAAGLLEKEMATIASMHEKLLADALELRKTYELQDAERKAQFEQDQREAERALREREEASLAKISSESLALDEKIKEFDTSDHMRARRKLREDISHQVQTALHAPQAPILSRFKFLLILLVCGTAAAVSGFFAYESFESFIAKSSGSPAIELSQNLAATLAKAALETSQSSERVNEVQSQSQDSGYLLWLLAARGALLSAVTVGFIAYLINVLRSSYDEDVRSHRELQRYGMDINRASWVIETAMEMTTKEGATLPDKWVEGAVHGLFQSQGKADAEVTSLAALGTIMGLAPEVSVGPDGTRINFSGKSTKRAAKDAE
ncbi:hypothetical protein [Sinorhizobium meliloti]|nr:hypothetical protein [Sinorhizobium meliloti]RVK16259.1 hypothetical protein CN164_04660 [Sinorhizobium meliloti]RVP88330.1 hypothetical protein CN073_17245 [Sinorhizobium meliloti]RVQ36069.1 hypothetical protein CN068_20775 [Sinorhizobium meliloti]